MSKDKNKNKNKVLKANMIICVRINRKYCIIMMIE